jgi:hypothetical protein
MVMNYLVTANTQPVLMDSVELALGWQRVSGDQIEL